MANSRGITSAIFEDEFFGELSFFHRLLWIGLFAHCADDQGRLLDNPTVIRSHVFPYDDILTVDIDEALSLFAAAGKIVRYQAGTKRLIQIVRWWDHQKMQWAQPSKYPAPDGWQDRIRYYTKGQYYSENWPEKSTQKTQVEELNDPKNDVHLDNPPGQSTWTADVTPVNHNHNHINHVKGSNKEAEKIPGNPYPSTPSASNSFADGDFLSLQDAFVNVTTMTTFPSPSRDEDLRRLRAIRVKFDNQLDFESYLKPFYAAWIGRKYRKTNTSWLDWAVANEIPPERRDKTGQPEPAGMAAIRAVEDKLNVAN